MPTLKAPFPFFGGKSRVSHLVWDRFGRDVVNYVEPFAGSLAVLLSRPGGPGRNETVNDADAFIANFWRAVESAPDKVAKAADWPVSEADLHARHNWLTRQDKFRERLLTDPDYFDPKIAGWWVWGISQWIGSGWCQRPDRTGHANAKKRPQIKRGGSGVHNRPPRQIPNLTATRANGKGVTTIEGETVAQWFEQLQTRLRGVRICCGDWRRVLGPCPTTKIGTTAVFLDPPYGDTKRKKVYGEDGYEIAGQVREWALANGDDPKLRIALCGYEGEHSMPDGWECIAWKTNGGYANQSNRNTQGRENAGRERIWFSPHCLQTPTLFDHLED